MKRTFQQFLDLYPDMRRAGPEENRRIIQFLAEQNLRSKHFRLIYDRSPNYFRLLELGGTQNLVGAFFDEPQFGEQPITGLTSTVIRPGYLGESPAFVGYLGDLRVSAVKRNPVPWRKMLWDLVEGSEEFAETGQCQGFLAAMMNENTKALQSLFHSDETTFNYRRLASYKILSILGRKPFHRCPLAQKYGFRIRRVHTSDEVSNLTDFMEKSSRQRPFGFRWRDHELSFRNNNWPGWKIENLFWVVDRHDRPIVSGGLWSPDFAKRMRIEDLSPGLNFLRSAVNLGRSRLRKIPRDGENFRTVYLTGIEADWHRPADDLAMGFAVMIDHLATQAIPESFPDSHLFMAPTYGHFDATPHLRHLLMNAMPAALYGIFPSRLNLQSIGIGGADVTSGLPPGFEMALV